MENSPLTPEQRQDFARMAAVNMAVDSWHEFSLTAESAQERAEAKAFLFEVFEATAPYIEDVIARFAESDHAEYPEDRRAVWDGITWLVERDRVAARRMVNTFWQPKTFADTEQYAPVHIVHGPYRRPHRDPSCTRKPR